MTTNELYEALDYVNHSRQKRQQYAHLILAQPELMASLMDIVFMIDDQRSCKAAWLAEFSVNTEHTVILPYLDILTARTDSVYRDAAIRPIAKIYECLALQYYQYRCPLTQKNLKLTHREHMVETVFNWLLTEQKVAVNEIA